MARGSLFLGLASALALFAVLTLLRGFQPEPPAEVAAQAQLPRYELRGVEWTRLDAQGRPLIEAVAGTIRYYDDESARFDTLEVRRLGANGPWNLTSPDGTMPAGEERLRLNPPVLITGRLSNGEPVQIDAESLWVDLQRKEIHTEDRVQLHAPNRQARARGLRADWAGTQLRLLNDVEV
ncbi:MAG TPA: LPS export ABC transporter periplasmic protein LptC, partial [Solimonas sp.]|nr:LPS export ABC transporter periplasmic protein LptC [Solimonas sp.]